MPSACLMVDVVMHVWCRPAAGGIHLLHRTHSKHDSVLDTTMPSEYLSLNISICWIVFLAFRLQVAGHRTGFGHPLWLETHPPAEHTAPAVQVTHTVARRATSLSPFRFRFAAMQSAKHQLKHGTGAPCCWRRRVQTAVRPGQQPDRC